MTSSEIQNEHRSVTVGPRQRVFAAWTAAALIMVWARWRVQSNVPTGSVFLPIACYQDIVLACVGAWASLALLRIARPITQRIIVAGTWTACMLLAFYSVLNISIFQSLRMPLTFRLIEMSGYLSGVDASIRRAMSPLPVIEVVLAPLMVIVLARLAMRFEPRLIDRGLRGFSQPITIILIILYAVAGRFIVAGADVFKPAVENPAWYLARTIVPHKNPFAAIRYPAAYEADFKPAAKPGPQVVSASDSSAIAIGTGARPRNVVMIILESTGSRHLQLYGAAAKDTPQMVRLADHAAVFSRVYVSQPFTSAAIPALFCSVYPPQTLLSIPNLAPRINLTGLPAVLGARGYRTAFFHDGQLDYDKQGEFLKNHGFAEVEGASHDSLSPRDAMLATQLTDWIKQDPSRPFMAAVWTEDSHHPYLAPTKIDFGVSGAALNRYLNSIHEGDAMIGAVADELGRMGLADDTLIVVTGDHGEAFGEHGQKAHNFTVYDEETRVPLMLINPRLFPTEMKDAALGRQIDIAPSILGLLGIPAPAEWQGTSLFSSDRPARAYLFANNENDEWALVSGDLKIIVSAGTSRAKVYDLATDPMELHDLAGDPQYAAQIAQARERLAAWFAYQTRFLTRRAAEGEPQVKGADVADISPGGGKWGSK